MGGVRNVLHWGIEMDDMVVFEVDGFVRGQEHETCNAKVIMGAHAGAGIEVVDEIGRFFNIPENFLVGNRGVALDMSGQWVVCALCYTGVENADLP